jgi:general stress protein 26
MSVSKRLLETLRRTDEFLFTLATVGADGCPHVRYMKGVIDDRLTIRCPTFASTQKTQDIQHCGEVALTCGDTDSAQPGSYFQISARAVISEDASDRAATWTPRLEKWFSGVDDSRFVVVKIVPTRIVACPIGGGPSAEVWIADR